MKLEVIRYRGVHKKKMLFLNYAAFRRCPIMLLSLKRPYSCLLGRYFSSDVNNGDSENDSVRTNRIIDQQNEVKFSDNAMPASPGWAKALDVMKAFEEKISESQSWDSESSDTDTEAEETPNEAREKQSFATLLKNSTFIQMGDPRSKKLWGTVMLREGNDLYIDFGSKFYCVCQVGKSDA